MNFDLWSKRVDDLLRLEYSITLNDAGLDHGELERHYDPERAPGDFVQWFANKFDLVSASELRFGRRYGPKERTSSVTPKAGA
jgi:hypothetical protein